MLTKYTIKNLNKLLIIETSLIYKVLKNMVYIFLGTVFGAAIFLFIIGKFSNNNGLIVASLKELLFLIVFLVVLVALIVNIFIKEKICFNLNNKTLKIEKYHFKKRIMSKLELSEIRSICIYHTQTFITDIGEEHIFHLIIKNQLNKSIECCFSRNYNEISKIGRLIAEELYIEFSDFSENVNMRWE